MFPKFIWAPCAQLYSLAETLQPPPPPALGLTFEAATGQPRQVSSFYDPLNGLFCSLGITYSD
jgi:hypothetical protein